MLVLKFDLMYRTTKFGMDHLLNSLKIIAKKMKDVVIIGGEGDGGNIGDFLQYSKTRDGEKLNFIGFLNDRGSIGHERDGYQVLGNLEDAIKFKDKGVIYFGSLV